MGGAFQGYVRHITVNPRELGLNGATILAGSPVTSETFSIAGWAQLSMDIRLARVAATAVTFYLETTLDGTNWSRAQASELVAGVETDTDHTVTKAGLAADKSWLHHFGGVLGDRARLVFDSTAGTTDTITVTVLLGVVG